MRQLARRSHAGVALGVANDLRHLVELYGGTDKGEHGYLSYYERHLGPYRLRANRLFEIGVGGSVDGSYSHPTPGGSLAVWRDYLPRTAIVGLDIEFKNVRLGPRVSFEQVDQKSHADLERVVDKHGPPNIVIDDGSHIGGHIIATFEFLWPRLPAGGLYVIEDLSTSYYPRFGGGDPAPHDSGVGLLGVLIDSAQALDPTFRRHPTWGTRSTPNYPRVAAVHTYPGIAFVEKV